MSSKKANQLEILHQSGLFNLPVSKSEGREFLSREKLFYDFCSVNYLGYDFSSYVHQKALQYGQQWGVLTSWSRMEADCDIYGKLEDRICKFLGAPEALLGLTITMNGLSIMPSLAKEGIIFADSIVHTVVWEACRLARDHGARLVKFKHQDLDHLESLLKEHENVFPKIIAIDGVYSISTELAPIREMQSLCDRYGAWLYVDDAHGFGILGENPNDNNPYGVGGTGIVNHWGGNYDRTFYVTSFGKAFCTQVAFTTIPAEFDGDLKAVSTQYLFSGPPAPYLIGATEAVMDLNAERGEEDRGKIRELVDYMLISLRSFNFKTYNNLKHPVVYLEVGELKQLMKVAAHLESGGILAGLRAFPVVPADRCGLRFSITALNSKKHIDRVLDLLSDRTLQEHIKRIA